MQDKPGISSPRNSQLRADVETAISSGATDEQSTPQLAEVLHELHVHQIELEMQNEALRQAQAELESSRIRYATLYDFAPVGYLTLTDSARIGQVNLTGATLLGARPDELRQCRFDDFVAKNEVDRWRQWFTGFKKQLSTRSIEIELQRVDSSRFYAHLDCRVLLHPGEAPVIYLTISDIGERKKTEMALKQLKDKLEDRVATRTAELVAKEALLSLVARLTATLAAVHKSILHDSSLHDVFLAACRAFVNEGGYKLAWMGQVDASGEKIEVRHAHGQGLGFLDALHVDIRPDSPAGNVPSAIACRRQSPYICPDFHSDPATLPWREQAGFHEIRSAIALPVIGDGMPWGVLTAYGENPQVFDAAAERVLQEIAQTLSFAIRYFATETQKRAAASALQESEALLQEAQKMAALGYWNYELDTRRLNWSPQLYRLCERDPASGPVDLADISACYVPESAELLERAIDRAIHAGDRVQLVLQAELDDGSLAHHALSLFPQLDAQGRTIKLYCTVQDITERQKLEHEREKYAARLAELSRHLVAVQEAARRQLAGELHDRTSPNLAAIDINFGIIAKSLPKARFAELSERLEDTQALIKDTSASIRDICADLRPPVLDYAGLGAALETYAQQFSRRTGIAVHTHCANPTRRLAPDIESLLFRIAQESLTNCTKHARASSIQLSLDNAHSPTVLSITDDGDGFAPDETGKGGVNCGLGILNMREMAEFAGGKFSIQSSPGQGTRVTVEIP